MSKTFLIYKNRVKSYLRKNKIRVSDDFYDGLNEIVKGILTKAASRAEKNRRSTVLPHDL